MSKIISFCKKALSFTLASVLMVSCMAVVGTVTGKIEAEAASAGDYFYRVTWKIIEGNNLKEKYTGKNGKVKDASGFSILYKANNGTSSTIVDKPVDISATITLHKDEQKTIVSEGSVPGFPVEFWAEHQDNYVPIVGSWFGACKIEYTKIEIGSSKSNYKTVWTGKAYLGSSNQLKTVQIDLSGESGNDSNNAYVTTNTKNWTMPAPASISGLSGETCIFDRTTITYTSAVKTGVIKDQYGVNWYQKPDYSILNSSNANATGASLITSGDGVKVNLNTNVLCDANGYNPSTGYINLTLKASKGSANQTVTYKVGALNNDDVFIDFATNKKIDVIENDGILKNVYGKAKMSVEGIAKGDVNSKATSSYSSSITSGSATLTASGGYINYKNTGFIETDETFTVLLKSSTDNKYYNSTLTIRPGKTVYYEDSLGSITYYGGWSDVSSQTSVVFDNIFDTVVAQNSVPGFSDSYNNSANSSEYSMGGAKKTTVYKGQEEPYAQFTFKGTGFDVIGLMNNSTGVVIVTVDEGTSSQKRFIVDTFANFVPKELGGLVDYVIDSNGTPVNYQVPVISISDLDFGTHTVKIQPKYAKAFDHDLSGQYDFYLDAIRIENPLGEANSFYHQGKMVYSTQSIKTLVLNQANQKLENALVISNNSVLSKEDYASLGPSNELYLKPGQTVAFNLSTNVKNPKVYLSGRGYCGSASVQIRTSSSTIAPISFTTKTELYKEITGLTWANGTQQVTITNNGNVSVSLCKIMVCGDEALMAAPAYVSFNAPVLASAMSLLERPITIEGDEQFYPESIEPSEDNTANLGDEFTMTVNTSLDVDRLTINGVDAEKADSTDTVSWSAPLLFNSVSSEPVEIIAYNSDGIKSESKIATVTVIENEVEEETSDKTTEIPSEEFTDVSEDITEKPETESVFKKIANIILSLINLLKNLFKA